jgi:hypothetical protein
MGEAKRKKLLAETAAAAGIDDTDIAAERFIRVEKIGEQLLDGLKKTNADAGDAVIALIDTIGVIVRETECFGCRKRMLGMLPKLFRSALAEANTAATARYGDGSAHVH